MVSAGFYQPHLLDINHSMVCIALLKVRNIHEITLVATDNGDPAQTTSVTVQININDINEFTPQFTQSVYSLSALALNDTQPGDHNV